MQYVELVIPFPEPEFWQLSDEAIMLASDAMIKNLNAEAYKKTFTEAVRGDTLNSLKGINICLYSEKHRQTIVSNLKIPTIKHGVGGCFTKMDTECGEVYGILLNIDSLEYADIFETIRHELVHYEQWQRGDLKITDEGIVWKDKLYPHNEINELMRCEAEEAIYRSIKHFPWEWEAYKDSSQLDELLSETPHWFNKIIKLY